MTTPGSGTRSQTSACNGATTAFPVSFRFVDPGDLYVYLLDAAGADNADGDLLTEGVDYTVSGDGRAGTASVTTLTAYASGKWLRRWRETSKAQPTDYVANDGFPADAHEKGLDRLSLIAEEIAAEQAAADLRSLKWPAGEIAETLPAKASFAGKFVVGDADGNLVPASAPVSGSDAALRADLAAPTGVSLVRMDGIRNQDISATYDASNPLSFGFSITSLAAGKQVDGIFLNHTITGAAGAGYGLHCIMTANAAVPFGNGGAIGGAANGDGAVSGGVFNRYEAGFGHGGICTRTGTGAGSGVLGTAQGTIGRQTGVSALKQNDDGTPTGACGPGSALEAINSANQGFAVESYTAENNVSGLSNLFERRNMHSGTITRDAILLGGVRTGSVTGHDILIQPATALTGAFAITGQTISLSANVTGATEATGLSISNSATGGVAAIGLSAAVLGNNTTNTALIATASGGTTNRAANLDGDVVTSGNIVPTGDNTKSLGTSANRFSMLYAGTGTINTSDAREKNWIGGLTDAHLRAARRIGQVLGLYQWIDQVADKGEAHARIHFGARAQDVIEIFYEEKLERRPRKGKAPSFRHAFLCYDVWEDGFEDILELRKVREKMTVREATGKVETTEPKVRVRNEDGSFSTVILPKQHRRIFADKQATIEKDQLVKVGERLARPAGHRYGLRLDQLALFLAAANAVRLDRLEQAAGR